MTLAKKDRDESGLLDVSSAKRRAARYTTEINIEDAAAYLEAIARALRENRLVVYTRERTLEAPVGPKLSLDVEAKTSRGGSKTSLELSLKWKERSEASSLATPTEAAPDESNEETVTPPASEPPSSTPIFDPE